MIRRKIEEWGEWKREREERERERVESRFSREEYRPSGYSSVVFTCLQKPDLTFFSLNKTDASYKQDAEEILLLGILETNGRFNYAIFTVDGWWMFEEGRRRDKIRYLSLLKIFVSQFPSYFDSYSYII